MTKRDMTRTGPTPRCFHNHQQFTIWMAAARNTGGCYETGYCTDCTPEYKQRMQDAKRCEHPEIKFAPDEHGFIQGVINDGTTDDTNHKPGV